MIGRASEQTLLLQRLEQLVEAGRKGVVVLEAEAGFGKSLLGAWLHGEALGLFTAPLLGASEPTTSSDAWHPWRQVFEEILGSAGPLDPEEVVPQVERAVAGQERLTAWIPLLNDLLPLTLPDNATTTQMHGTPRSDALGEVLTAILNRHTAEQPRLLLLEDVHWMDSTSWGLLRAAVRGVDRLLVVLLTRPLGNRAPSELTEILDRRDCDHLHLERLDDPQIEELARARLRVDALPPPVARTITSRAEGNPFYAQELCHALRQTGRIEVEDRVCRILDPDVAADLPDTLQGVLTSRLDALDPRHGVTAKVASVIGRSFGRRLLAGVHPQAEARDDLETHLLGLADAGIAEAEADVEGAPWSFRHAIIQEAAYSLLPFAQRRELHAAVARWYEAHPDDDGSEGALLGWHWRRAEQPKRAVAALERAGFAAQDRGANRECVALLEEALELDGQLAAAGEAAPPMRVARWHHVRADAWMQMGDMARSKELFQHALDLLGFPAPRSTAGWIGWLLRELATQLRHRLLPFPSRRQSAPEERARLTAAAEALSSWGAAGYFTMEPLHWFLGGIASVNIADRLGDDQACGEALGAFGNVVGAMKLQRAARHYFRRNDHILDARDRCVGLWGEAVFDLTYCRWERAREVVDRGLDLVLRISERYAYGLAYTIRALVRFGRGELEGADEDFEAARESGRQIGNTEHESWGLIFGAPALLARGRDRELATNLTAAEALIPVLDPFTHVSFHGVRAQQRARGGDLDAALADVAAMLELYAKTPLAMFTHLAGFGGAAEAVLLAREAQVGGATLTLPEGWTLDRLDRKAAGLMSAGAFSYLYFRPRRRLLQGTRAWLKGQGGAARRGWRKAMATAERLGMPYEAALVALERARQLPVSSDEQREAAVDARRRLGGLGAAGDLARLDRLDRLAGRVQAQGPAEADAGPR